MHFLKLIRSAILKLESLQDMQIHLNKDLYRDNTELFQTDKSANTVDVQKLEEKLERKLTEFFIVSSLVTYAKKYKNLSQASSSNDQQNGRSIKRGFVEQTTVTQFPNNKRRMTEHCSTFAMNYNENQADVDNETIEEKSNDENPTSVGDDNPNTDGDDNPTTGGDETSNEESSLGENSNSDLRSDIVDIWMKVDPNEKSKTMPTLTSSTTNPIDPHDLSNIQFEMTITIKSQPSTSLELLNQHTRGPNDNHYTQSNQEPVLDERILITRCPLASADKAVEQFNTNGPSQISVAIKPIERIQSDRGQSQSVS